MNSYEKKEKYCAIINMDDGWKMEVDKHTIPFRYHENAEYFAEHYKTLGYEIKWFHWRDLV